MKSTLQFNTFKVLEIIYKNNLGESEDLGSPTFGVNISLNAKNNKQAMIRLSVEIGNDKTESYVKAEIAGFFTFEADEEISEEVLVNYYQVNGTAILFPYLRSIVSDITSKSDNSPIILPTVNIHAMIFDSEEDEDFDQDEIMKNEE